MAVFVIDRPGHVVRMPDVVLPNSIEGGQSIVLSPDGRRDQVLRGPGPVPGRRDQVCALKVKPLSEEVDLGGMRLALGIGYTFSL